MLHNVVDMTNALYDLQQSGVCITPELAARLSPYLTEHIKRFGQYGFVNLSRLSSWLGNRRSILGWMTTGRFLTLATSYP